MGYLPHLGKTEAGAVHARSEATEAPAFKGLNPPNPTASVLTCAGFERNCSCSCCTLVLMLKRSAGTPEQPGASKGLVSGSISRTAPRTWMPPQGSDNLLFL